jgi:hypothetical protein
MIMSPFSGLSAENGLMIKGRAAAMQAARRT